MQRQCGQGVLEHLVQRLRILQAVLHQVQIVIEVEWTEAPPHQ